MGSLTNLNRMPRMTIFHPFRKSWNLSVFIHPFFDASSQQPLKAATSPKVSETKNTKKINPVIKMLLISTPARKPTRSIPRTTFFVTFSLSPESLFVRFDSALAARVARPPTAPRARFSTWTDVVWREDRMVEGWPPVERWYQVHSRWRNPTRIIPMLHWKFCVQDCTIGGKATLVMPIMA